MADVPPIKPTLVEGSVWLDQKINYLIQRYIESHENIMHVDWTITGPEVIHTDRYIEGGPGTDTTAIHDDTAAEISAITEKVAPVGADLVLIEDSADSFNKKFVQISNLPTGGEPLSMGLENPTASENKYLFFTPVAVTITAVRMVLVGSSTPSVTMNIKHSTDRSDATPNSLWTVDEVITNVTTGDAGAAFDDATIPANSYVWFVTTAQSGTVTEFDLYGTYTLD